MKRTCFALLLLAPWAVGCNLFPKEPRPETPPKPVAVRSTGDDVPAALGKLLPSNQLNSENYKAQAQLMYDTLQKEKGQLEKMASASRE